MLHNIFTFVDNCVNILMMKNKIIIGVTGTHASGKDTVANYICEKYKTNNYSTSEEIGYELTERGMDHSRQNKFALANEIRENFGTSELAKRALGRVKEDIAVITALRNIGEIDYLKQNSLFYLIAVDAPIDVRYERAVKRERIGDGKSLADFKAGEEKEMNVGVTGQQLLPCMRLADYFILNDGTLDHLKERTEEVLSAIMNRAKEESSN